MPPLSYALSLVFVCWSAVAAAADQSALRIVVISGEDAVNIVQQKTAVAPVVEVGDRNNLPVAGATVTFSVGQGATFGGAPTLTVVTNAAGQAAAAGITPTAAGAINISATATFQGQTAAVTIAQANVLTAAEAAKIANTGASASGGGASAGKIIAIVGGVGAAGAGAAVAAGGSGSETTSSLTFTPTGSNPGAPTGATPATPPATPTPPAVSNAPPVITAATATPTVGLVSVTPIVFDVQATDADNNALTYFWEFPDGTTSDQRSFSRVFNVGGTHNSRITVRDGTASTSREFSFEMKTVTGEWADSRSGLRVLSLVQNGSSVTGTMPGGDTCTLTGSVRANAPHVILDVACRYTVVNNGLQIAHGTRDYHMELQLDAVLSGLSGTETVRTTNISLHGFVQQFEHTSAVQFNKR